MIIPPQPTVVAWLLLAALLDPKYAAIVRRDWRMLRRAERKDERS